VAEVSQDAWPDETEVPSFEGEAIRSTAASFENRTPCPRGLHPKHLGKLSDDLLDKTARQWTLWERYGQLPLQERQLVVTLISKPDGGLRPIALYRAASKALTRVNVSRL
jgi:hypothetical protein